MCWRCLCVPKLARINGWCVLACLHSFPPLLSFPPIKIQRLGNFKVSDFRLTLLCCKNRFSRRQLYSSSYFFTQSLIASHLLCADWVLCDSLVLGSVCCDANIFFFSLQDFIRLFIIFLYHFLSLSFPTRPLCVSFFLFLRGFVLGNVSCDAFFFHDHSVYVYLSIFFHDLLLPLPTPNLSAFRSFFSLKFCSHLLCVNGANCHTVVSFCAAFCLMQFCFRGDSSSFFLVFFFLCVFFFICIFSFFIFHATVVIACSLL